jgi:hypothetical protein
MGKLKKTTSILLVFALLFTFSFPFNNKHVVAKTSSSKTQPEQTSSSENNNEKEISKVRIESLDNNDKDLYVEVENLKDKVIVTSYLGDKKIDQSVQIKGSNDIVTTENNGNTHVYKADEMIENNNTDNSNADNNQNKVFSTLEGSHQNRPLVPKNRPFSATKRATFCRKIGQEGKPSIGLSLLAFVYTIIRRLSGNDRDSHRLTECRF